MPRYIQISKLLLSLSLSLIIFSDAASAATISIDQIELGKVIDINGQKFVKVRSDAGKGSQFMAFQPAVMPGFANGMDMDQFTPAMCNSAPTPSATEYFLIGNLVDSRDGKSYEVRKFADGKCWMVENLAYGGATDACASKTTFSGNGSATPTNIFGTSTYGDCRNNPGTNYGYLYNWQAAMQHASAYYGSSYTGPTTNVQGICPQGWHIPSGNAAGEYQALHTSTGSNVTFWQNIGSWKGVLSGLCDSSGSLLIQGSDGFYWSSTHGGTSLAYLLYFNSSTVSPRTDYGTKNYGLTIRCVKDTVERTMQNFTTADCESYATPTGTNYTAIGMLKDERDGKWYEIRKFADGKCWMVDNLAYGGAVDVCANSTDYSGYSSSATPTNFFGAGTYGGCWDPSEQCSSDNCGYFYDWQGAMQHAYAYEGSDYTGPTVNVQGICPTGWHLPSGGPTGEYQALDVSIGSVAAFWQSQGNWKDVYVGRGDAAGSFYFGGGIGVYWSSTQDDADFAYHLFTTNDAVIDVDDTIDSKAFGQSVRCVKN